MSRDVSPPPLKRRRLNNSDVKPLQRSEREITVYSWNVNGIAPLIQRPITSFFASASAKSKEKRQPSQDSDDEVSAPPLREVLRRHGWPTLLFLQEVKINPDDSATITAVEKAASRQAGERGDLPSYQARFCLPSDKHNARGFGRKVYGVCSLIRTDFYDKYVDNVRSVPWDQEGRFLILETKAMDDTPKLAIINVYAVNGTDNTYKDPATGQPAGTRHSRKLQVHALLQEECQRLESKGFGCIIAGDINIARIAIDGFPNLRTSPTQHCVNRADFETRFISDDNDGNNRSRDEPSKKKVKVHSCLKMIDSFRHLHPARRGYTYYPRTKSFGDSCDRVDMILLSRRLEPHLKAADMHETPAERGPSDHVPLYVKLDFGKDT